LLESSHRGRDSLTPIIERLELAFPSFQSCSTCPPGRLSIRGSVQRATSLVNDLAMYEILLLHVPHATARLWPAGYSAAD
jgi:hypothetical protein